MSLAYATPEPLRRTGRKPAAKKPAPAAKPKDAAPHLIDAERLFRRFEQLLPEGEHAFARLALDFAEWCECGHIAPPTAVTLAAWLKAAGLVSYRSGRAKTTIYAKHAARLAA